MRTTLVVGQVAVSVVLLVVTGLFVRSLVAGTRADPGFAADRLAGFQLSVDVQPEANLAGRNVQVGVLNDIAGLAGVDGVTLSDGPMPGVARSPMDIDVPGVLPEPGQDRLIVDARTVGARFFRVAGIPLRSGRDFTEADERDGPPVAVVSEAFVRRFWPGQDPLGRSFTAGGQDVRVVGVAADARYLLQDDTPDPIVYLSLAGRFLPRAQVLLSARAPLEVSRDVNEVVSRAVPGHTTIRMRSARDALRDALLPQRLGSVIVGAMGLAALLLAAVGLYGLIQFSVTRDTHELGVRLALGGRGLDLLAVVLRRGFLLVATGTALGIGIAFLAAPALGSFLVGVSAADPVTYGAVVAAFAVVALVASWIPARRAARVHPMEALRSE